MKNVCCVELDNTAKRESVFECNAGTGQCAVSAGSAGPPRTRHPAPAPPCSGQSCTIQYRSPVTHHNLRSQFNVSVSTL